MVLPNPTLPPLFIFAGVIAGLLFLSALAEEIDAVDPKDRLPEHWELARAKLQGRILHRGCCCGMVIFVGCALSMPNFLMVAPCFFLVARAIHIQELHLPPLLIPRRRQLVFCYVRQALNGGAGVSALLGIAQLAHVF